MTYPYNWPHHARQGGAALLVLLGIILTVFSVVVVSALSNADLETQRQQKTLAALAQAKEALIAWSVTRGSLTGNARPGEFPCPDSSDPETDLATYGQAAGTCSSGKIGRLPWKELGIPELLDANGEPLWYAVDGAFRTRFGTAWTTNQPINSDTRASLQVYASNGTTLLTPTGEEAAAIVFSAGSPMGSQSRSTSSERKAASNYLNAANGRNNATNGGPFIQGPIRDVEGNIVNNDQILIISGRELISATERRVAREALTLLQVYRATNGFYPYPAHHDAPGCIDTGSSAYMTDCQSDANICRGRFPDNATEAASGLPNWDATKRPDWFTYNLWGQTLYYAVGSSSLKSPSPTLLSKCSSNLTIGTNTGVIGALITAGAPKGTLVRSKHTPTLVPQSTTLADYLESPENQDGWTGSKPDADTYAEPGSNSNDRIYKLP